MTELNPTEEKVKSLLVKHDDLIFSPNQTEKDYDGILIVLEGNDGAGKTTLSKSLVEMINLLSDIPRQATYVRTPGGTELGEKLREMLLDPEYQICDIAEALLFQAQLAQCIQDVIKPLLERGNIVICDRLIFSTLAYQACGREQNMEYIWDIQIESLQNVWPDFGFMLSNPVEKINSGDRIENAGKEFSLRVKTFYDNILETNKTAAELMTRFTVLPDVSQSTQYLYNEVKNKLNTTTTKE